MRVFHLSADFVEPQHIVRNVQFHPDGHTLFALIGPPGDADAACWWDLREDRIQRLLSPNDDFDDYWDGRMDPAVDSDLELFAMFRDDEHNGSLRVLDFWRKPTESRYFYAPDALTYERVAFAPESGLLYAVLTDVVGNASVLWWDIEEAFDEYETTNLASDPFELEGELRPTAMACSPDGVTVVLATNRELRVLDFALWRETQLQLRDPRHAVTGLTFSNNGSLLLVQQGGLITVWDAMRWQPLTDLTGDAAMTAAAYSPDGRTLALTAADGTVSFRDATTFAERVSFAWGVGALHSVAFAPDGLTCAAGADSGRIVLWDVEG